MSGRRRGPPPAVSSSAAAKSPALVWRVAAFAAAVRVAVVVLAVVGDALVSDYDTSAQLPPARLVTAGGGGAANSHVDDGTGAAFKGLASWDGVFFVSIAADGYRFENAHAFFPLLPLLMRVVAATLFAPLHLAGVSHRTVLLLAGVALSNACFVLSVVQLYRLSLAVLPRRPQLALAAALLYAATPAGIFMSAVYTEALFALCSLSGFVALLPSSDSDSGSGSTWRGRWLAALCFAGATATRSNGTLLLLFLIADALRRCWHWWRWHHRRGRRASVAATAAALLTRALEAGALCALAIAPLVAFQVFGYLRFCQPAAAAVSSPWCAWRVPNLYAYVQQHYWNNGFLNYFEMHQLPNFVLATPMVVLSVLGIGLAAVRTAVLLLPAPAPAPAAATTQTATVADQRQRFGLPPVLLAGGGTSTTADASTQLPYHALWLALAATLPFIHVQVFTRLVAFCPPVYWFAAELAQRHRALAVLVLLYFVGYTVAGALLFPNFYPWT